MQDILAPIKFLQGMVGKRVAVKLKWGMEYRGKFYVCERQAKKEEEFAPKKKLLQKK